MIRQSDNSVPRTAKRFHHAAQEWTRSGLSWEMRFTHPNSVFGPQRGPVMQPKGVEPWRGSLGFRGPHRPDPIPGPPRGPAMQVFAPIGHRTAKRFHHAAQEWMRSGLSWDMRFTHPIPYWTTTWSCHAAQGCRASARLPWGSRATPPPSRSRTATRSRQAAFRGCGDVRVTEPR
jgi:hypothetical protein